jgi:hypothetical protein
MGSPADDQIPARGAAVKHTDLAMYPFIYNANGRAAALHLASEAAHVEKPEYNMAMIELIGGIAAIENEEDRHVLAFDVIKHLFTFTDDAHKHMLSTVEKYHRGQSR